MSVNVSFVTNLSSSYYGNLTSTLYNSLVIDGSTFNSPYSASWALGSTHSIYANSPSLTYVGEIYGFGSWSDGGAQSHNVSASAGVTQFIASYGLIPQMVGDYDILIFIQHNYSGSIFSSNGSSVPLMTQFPDTINQLPIVTLNPHDYHTEWAAIGAARLRYYQDVDMFIWTSNPADRFAIENSIRKQTTTINKPIPQTLLAINYVFMYHPEEAYNDDATLFGTVLYRSHLKLHIIYDLIRPL